MIKEHDCLKRKCLKFKKGSPERNIATKSMLILNNIFEALFMKKKGILFYCQTQDGTYKIYHLLIFKELYFFKRICQNKKNTYVRQNTTTITLIVDSSSMEKSSEPLQMIYSRVFVHGDGRSYCNLYIPIAK